MDFKRNSIFYKDGALFAKTKNGLLDFKTVCLESENPVYFYNSLTVSDRVNAYKEAFSELDTHIHFAVKSNPNLQILQLVHSLGCGADVVSIGEFNHAIKAGFNPQNIIFSGVGKTKKEIHEALTKNVKQINCESLSEVKRVADISKALNLKASIGVRINPDISVKTHPYIATGFRENKFGIPLGQIPELVEILKSNLEFLQLKGLSCHIGSQIMEAEPLVKAAESLISLARELKTKGQTVQSLDIGGGLGVDYQSDDEDRDLTSIKEFGSLVAKTLKDFDGEICLEPGRSIVARSGVLLARVEYIKSNGFKNFIVLNTGMHHLLRPSLYQAYHKIVPLELRESKVGNFDFVGPICESSDVLGYDRALPQPEEGDWVAILDAGAYGMSMVSGYNIHPYPTEVLV